MIVKLFLLFFLIPALKKQPDLRNGEQGKSKSIVPYSLGGRSPIQYERCLIVDEQQRGREKLRGRLLIKREEIREKREEKRKEKNAGLTKHLPFLLLTETDVHRTATIQF